MNISLISCAAKPPENVFLVNIPLSCIHALRQMRGKMSEDGLEELTASIKEATQLNPGIIVALSKSASVTYLRRINEMWGTNYRITQFAATFIKEKKEFFYLFLVAGHRRLRAVTNAKLGHFYCYLRLETNFSKALHLQFQENLHEEVAPEDQARFLSLFWREEKEAKPTITLATFAKSLGKRPEVVRKSIRFTTLPVTLQKLVQPSKDFKKGIGFGLLCELARLQEARIAKKKPYNEQELIQLAYAAVTQQKTVKATAAWVTEHINELEGQDTMFELSIQEVSQSSCSSAVSGVERVIRAGNHHLSTVARFHEGGHVERIASQSAVSAVNGTLSLVSDIAPKIIDGLKGGKGSQKVRREIEKAVRRA